MSIAGGHDRAVNAAASFGFKCVQLFTKNNNQWKAPVLTDAHIARFGLALINTGVTDPVAHNSYLINLARPCGQNLGKERRLGYRKRTMIDAT